MDYKKALAKDRKLAKIFKHEVILPERKKHITMSLVNSIMSQQLSTQVAKVMRERFLVLFDGKAPSAKKILEMPVEKIKGIGISQSKANYIHNVAEFMLAHKITDNKLNKMSDDEIIELLTQIKGIGRWTVEMILIFSLGREDIFAVDDLGIQKGMIELFGLHDLSKKDLRLKMMKLSEKWSPYRSFVCLHLWRSADAIKKEKKDT
jgi:DNA-3-methyladenine glycosylase II